MASVGTGTPDRPAHMLAAVSTDAPWLQPPPRVVWYIATDVSLYNLLLSSSVV